MFIELVRVAIGALVVNRLRTILTMLGIVIGTGAVIAMVGLGKGAEQQVLEQIAEQGGARMLYMSPDFRRAGLAWVPKFQFTLDDVRALKTGLPRADAVLVMSGTTVDVRYRGTNFAINVIGTTPDYYKAFPGYQLTAGRFLMWEDNEERRPVAVLCADAMKNLSGSPHMIGDEIRIRGNRFTVVGVLDPAGRKYGWNLDDDILVPVEALQTRGVSRPEGLVIQVVAKTTADLEPLAQEVRTVFRHAHNIRPGSPDPVWINSWGGWQEARKQTAATFGLMLAAIAAVSLVVGGIGVMNIMLVSVTERTQEIGIRKALGAKRTSILVQFLLESAALCLIGGLLGIAAGAGSAKFLGEAYQWNIIVTREAIVLAVASSLIVGVASGLYPAIRAAWRDPVEALRYE